MRLVRDAEAAAGVDEPERDPGPEREPAGSPDRRRDVLDERAGVEDVRRPERMQPEQLEMRRGDRSCRRCDEVGGVHPELAGAVVADEPDALEPARSETAARSRTGWTRARARGDRLEPGELAGRLDGDRADPGRDRGTQLVVALARARS